MCLSSQLFVESYSILLCLLVELIYITSPLCLLPELYENTGASSLQIEHGLNNLSTKNPPMNPTFVWLKCETIPAQI